MTPMTDPRLSIADLLEDLLPQTQCTKCGYPSCRLYAEAMADGSASHNQCPPGGAEGVARLASALGKTVIPINPDNGTERERPGDVDDPADDADVSGHRTSTHVIGSSGRRL